MGQFAEFIPRKCGNHLRKGIRRLRRVAGDVRNLDVFLSKLSIQREVASPSEVPAIDFLLGYVHAQRAESRQLLVGFVKRLERDGFKHECTSYLVAVRAPKGPTQELRDLFRPNLTRQLMLLDAAIAEDVWDDANIHRVRIRGKKLRYSMEIFAHCFQREFMDGIYRAVEQLQDILGRFHDGRIVIARLAAIERSIRELDSKIGSRLEPGLSFLIREAQLQTEDARHAFLAWKQEWISLDISGRVIRHLQSAS
jgi:CHAD domain-containing protein